MGDFIINEVHNKTTTEHYFGDNTRAEHFPLNLHAGTQLRIKLPFLSQVSKQSTRTVSELITAG